MWCNICTFTCCMTVESSVNDYKIASNKKHEGQLGACEGGASASLGEDGVVIKIVMQLPTAMDRHLSHNMGHRLR